MATTTPITVRIRLHRGDARIVVAPVAVIGDRSPIRAWLEREHGAVFEPVVVREWHFKPNPPAPPRHGAPASGPWRHVISVRTNVRRERGTRLANDLSDALDYSFRQWTPSEILVLPLTWREPHAVAMNTLMAIWLLAYYSRLVTLAPWSDRQFILASLDGTDHYIEALNHDAMAFYDWLAPIFERDAVSFFGPKPVLDKQKVRFDWSETS